jgi:hypothetical protein
MLLQLAAEKRPRLSFVSLRVLQRTNISLSREHHNVGNTRAQGLVISVKSSFKPDIEEVVESVDAPPSWAGRGSVFRMAIRILTYS